jgi:hypothetical protein
MDTGKNTLSEDIINQILNDEKLRNEILEKAAKDKTMQEKLNNHCCVPYPVPSSIVPFPFSVTGCGINYHEEYNRDCKYYDEEHDMGATIPICTKYDKFGNFNCNECYKYKR